MGQRPPENGLPQQTPVFQEADAIRYELPVVVGKVKGTLVIRYFEGHDVEASIRGQAAALLERWWP